MNTNQEDSIRRARMEALADKQRSELPDVQAAALQAAIDAEDADTAAEIARAIRNRLLKDSDAEVALDRLGLQVPSGATFTAWLSFLRTLGEALVGSWAEYRQLLRDLPQQEGWPLAIQWPTAPGSEEEGEQLHMSNLEVICRLCDLLDRAQQIIRQQAELLSMHGVETDGKALERQRSELLAEIERSI